MPKLILPRRPIPICQTYWWREELRNLKPEELPSSRQNSTESRLTQLRQSMKKILRDTSERIRAWLFSSGSTGPSRNDTELK